MKKNKPHIPVLSSIEELNNKSNELFRDKVFIPMVTFATTLLVFVILLDYTFQLIDAIDILAS